MLRIAGLLMMVATAADAGGLIAARTLPAGSVLTAADMIMGEASLGVSAPSEAIGMQTRVTLYEGRPILASQLQQPKLVSRNQIVRLGFKAGALDIQVEGRALAEGAAGDTIRVMNVASRTTVFAQVNPDGTLTVTK